jgi:predicted glycogen debranching enzyme
VYAWQVTFGPQVCGDLSVGACREWLVPDGCGGYAMGTVSGLRTRRYHGLLVVSGTQPGVRRVGLAALDPVLILDGTEVRLGVHEWAPGSVSPAGHEYLRSFTLRNGLPRWQWQVGGVVLERELAMVPGRPALAVVHRLLAGGPVRLALEVLATWRDAHGERYATGPAPRVVSTADGLVVEDAYRVAGPGFCPGGEWYHGAYLREERARGLAASEDLWYAGRFVADLSVGDELPVSAWAGDLDSPPPPPSVVLSCAARRSAALVAGSVDDVGAALAVAADAFVIRGPDVVAGYPWFGAWSRDTMISYEGLFLTAGRFAEGAELLLRYGSALDSGMLPNTTDSGEPVHNSVDAALWFVHAVGRHVAVTGDTCLGGALLPALLSVVRAYRDGTRYGIRVDPSTGLVLAGAPGHALTWMDAVVDGVPVTPRAGAAVDINALWVNALGVVASLAPGWSAQHDEAVASFRRSFPMVHGGLSDVVGDDTVRPNQLLAYSLPYGPLRGRAPAASVDALLTPLGLRTLAPDAPGYTGRHRGGPTDRDRAYHQGTVWPWLIGPYVDARLAAGLPVDGLLDGLVAHLGEYGVGSVSETADGDPPHAATGCPFQAWSVAELFRVRRRLMCSSR